MLLIPSIWGNYIAVWLWIQLESGRKSFLHLKKACNSKRLSLHETWLKGGFCKKIALYIGKMAKNESKFSHKMTKMWRLRTIWKLVLISGADYGWIQIVYAARDFEKFDFSAHISRRKFENLTKIPKMEKN